MRSALWFMPCMVDAFTMSGRVAAIFAACLLVTFIPCCASILTIADIAAGANGAGINLLSFRLRYYTIHK